MRLACTPKEVQGSIAVDENMRVLFRNSKRGCKRQDHILHLSVTQQLRNIALARKVLRPERRHHRQCHISVRPLTPFDVPQMFPADHGAAPSSGGVMVLIKSTHMLMRERSFASMGAFVVRCEFSRLLNCRSRSVGEVVELRWEVFVSFTAVAFLQLIHVVPKNANPFVGCVAPTECEGE